MKTKLDETKEHGTTRQTEQAMHETRVQIRHRTIGCIPGPTHPHLTNDVKKSSRTCPDRLLVAAAGFALSVRERSSSRDRAASEGEAAAGSTRSELHRTTMVRASSVHRPTLPEERVQRPVSSVANFPSAGERGSTRSGRRGSHKMAQITLKVRLPHFRNAKKATAIPRGKTWILGGEGKQARTFSPPHLGPPLLFGPSSQERPLFPGLGLPPSGHSFQAPRPSAPRAVWA